MVKSFKVKKLMLLFLSIALVCSVVLGILAVNGNKSVKAEDVRAEDMAVYNDAVYDIEKVRPYWYSTVMYNETCLPFTDGTNNWAYLRYNPAAVMRVTNYDGTVVYKEGTDYIVNGKQFDIPSGSSIVTIPHEVAGSGDAASFQKALDSKFGARVYQISNAFDVDMETTGGVAFCGALYTEGSLFNDHYLCVSYVMQRDGATGELLEVSDAVTNGDLTCFDDAYYAKLRAKLVPGNTINMLVIGDSITQGSSSSKRLGISPYQKGYTALVAEELERVYGVKVNHHTIAVGGTNSTYLHSGEQDAYGGSGTQKFAKALGLYDFDYCILAYGMNDLGALYGGVNAAEGQENYKSNIDKIISDVIADSPDCSFTLVNTFHRHDAIDYTVGTRSWYSVFYTKLNELASKYNKQRGDAEIRVVDMFKVSQHLAPYGTDITMMGYKRFAEIAASNNNHPNDWMHRIYAMNVCASLINYSKITKYTLYRNDDKFNSANLFSYSKNVNGWLNYYYDDNPYGTSTHDTVWKEYFTNTSKISGKMGVLSDYDRQGGTEFAMIYGNFNVNLNAYDVTKPITFSYAVNPSVEVGSGNNFNTIGDFWGHESAYGFSLHKSLDSAFTDASGYETYSFHSPNNSIMIYGSNKEGSETQLYGKLRASSNDVGGGDSGELFNTTNHTVDTWQSYYITITVYIGETNTTVYANGVKFSTLNNVNRSYFPDGLAYMKASANGNVVLKIKDGVQNGLVNSSTGTRYDYAKDVNGWATYVVSNQTYVNDVGEVEVATNFGIERVYAENGYSVLGLFDANNNAAYTVNYTKLDVTKPIQIEYVQHPYGRYGDYTFSLFDSVSKAHKAQTSMWSSDYAGPISWRGAGITANVGDYDLNKSLLIQGSIYVANVYGSQWTPWKATTMYTSPVKVTFDIGTSNTKVWVNGGYVGTINVTRENFTTGYAYLGVCGSVMTDTASLAIKAPNQDVNEMGYILADGMYDANGYYRSVKNDYSDSLGIFKAANYNDSTAGLGIFHLNEAYTFNKNPLAIDKEMVFTINLNKGLTNTNGASWYVSLFGCYDDLMKAGINGYNGSYAKFRFYGATGADLGDYNDLVTANASSNVIGRVDSADYVQNGIATVRVFFGTNAADSYVKINGTTVATGSSVGTRDMFQSGKCYIGVYGLGGEQRFELRALNSDTKSIDTNKVVSSALTLNDGITMSASATLGANFANPQMSFAFNGQNQTVTTYANNSGKYTFKANDIVITPQYMHKQVTVNLYAKDYGAKLSVVATKNISVRDYVTAALNTSLTAKEKAVIVDLVNYGAAAQQYAGVDTGDLANNALGSNASAGTTFNANNITSVKTVVNSNEVKLASTSLVLGDKVTVRYYFNLNSAMKANTSRVSVEFNIGGRVVNASLTASGDSYYADLTNITPIEFASVITAKVKVDGAYNGCESTYSVNTFVKEQYNSSNATANALYKALYNLGVSARAYKGI